MTFHFRALNTNTMHKNPTNVSVDRIDSTKGYVRDNVQLTQAVVNIAKSDMPDDLFLALCHDVHYWQSQKALMKTHM